MIELWRYSSYSPPENRRPPRFREYAAGGREQRGESQAAGTEPGEYFSLYCSLTLTLTVKLLRRIINWYRIEKNRCIFQHIPQQFYKCIYLKKCSGGLVEDRAGGWQALAQAVYNPGPWMSWAASWNINRIIVESTARLISAHFWLDENKFRHDNNKWRGCNLNQFSLLIRMKKKTNVFSLTKIFKIVFAYGYKDYY